MNKNSELFKERFNKLVEDFDISYADLAKKTGITKASISDYKVGKSIPNNDKMYTLANFFDVDPAYLAGYNVPKNSKFLDKILTSEKSMEDKYKKFFSSQLSKIMFENNLDRYELVKKLNDKYSNNKKELFKYTTLTDWIKGNSLPRIDKIEMLANFFNVDKNYFLNNDNNTNNKDFDIVDIDLSKTVKIPHLGSIRAGFEYSPDYYDGEFFEIPYVFIKKYVREDLFTLTVKGESMYPSLVPNDVVLINKGLVVNNGDIVAVMFGNGEESTIKKYYKDDKNKTVSLISSNPEYPDKIYKFKEAEELGLKVLGKVVSLVRREF